MNFNDQDIAAIETLGYTPDEARFLYLVAVHSGYFVPRQFLTFSGAKWGKRSNNFVSKLESRGHVTWREYDRTGGVYHLFSKTLYRLIGKENLRNRRRHSLEFIRTRLVLLDFVLANLGYGYLETEPEKVRFFTETLGVPKNSFQQKPMRAGRAASPRCATSSINFLSSSIVPTTLLRLWSPFLMSIPARPAWQDSRITSMPTCRFSGSLKRSPSFT